MTEPTSDPAEITRLADAFVAQDAAGSGRSGKLPPDRAGKGAHGPSASSGSVRIPATAPISAATARPTKGARPRKGQPPTPVPRPQPPTGPIPTPVPAPNPLLGQRTLGLFVGFLAIILIVVGGSVLTAGRPATTAVPLPSATSPALIVSTGEPGASSVPVASNGRPSQPGATQPAPPPTAGPRATASPASTGKPKPTQTATVVAFAVSPTKASGVCKSGLSPFLVTLDNKGSTVAVAWTVSFAASPSYKGDWGSAKPSSGSVPAGGTASLTITPNDLCPAIQGATAFRVDVNAGKAGTFTITYDVTP